jgi:hypothetical protein
MEMDGVREEYERLKKRRGQWMVQLLSASCRIPVGLGNVVIYLYISATCGQVGGKESGTVGLVPKRKWWRIGPSQLKGSIAKGMSVMLLCKMSLMIASPGMVVPVVGSCLLPRLSFCFS